MLHSANEACTIGTLTDRADRPDLARILLYVEVAKWRTNGSFQLSSLSRLKQFPVDIIKIDREFVTGLEHNLSSRLIVGAVVGLAHGLGMKVVAEGIETRGQRDEVAELGCDFSQGFYFARPLSVNDMDALVSTSDPFPRPRIVRPMPETDGTRSPDDLVSAASEGFTPLAWWGS